jgi:hypothetical protein
MKFIAQLLGRHLQRYPQMELADIYKLLHQAAMGPGHAIADPEQARAALRTECAALEGEAGAGAEPLIDPISPDGRLARVHLRSYLASGCEIDALAEAFVRTPEVCPSAPDKLARFCACLGELADARGIPFTRAEVADYFAGVAEQGYPVVRHSQRFRSAYRPAYRVVAADLLPAR